MSISILKVHDEYNATNYMEFTIDTDDDVTALPGLGVCAAGSLAISIASGKTFRLGHTGLWIASDRGSDVDVEALTATSNGEYIAEDGKAYNPVTVNVPTGGGGAEQKDVNFIDYDGTILYSYTPAEFAALTAMPENPAHTGLTAQGWNWALAQAKAYVVKYGKLWIGQMYITDDGKTRVYIHLEKGRTSSYLGMAVNGTADVDWGDGTAHDTVTGTSTSTVINTLHNYPDATADYMITIDVTGSMSLVGNSGYGSQLLWKNSTTGSQNRAYQNAVRRVEIGSNTTIGSDAFNSCYSLESVTIPDGVTSILTRAFYNCYSLESVTIPDGVTSIGSYAFGTCYSFESVTIPDGVTSILNNAFNSCYSLESVTIPDGVTSILNSAFRGCSGLTSVTIPDGVMTIADSAFSTCLSFESVTIPDGVTSILNNAFNSCYSLASITIPDSVMKIAASAFSACYGLGFIRFESATPPTVENSNAFTNIPTDCVIYVPSDKLNDYKTATNYPDPSTYTYVGY